MKIYTKRYQVYCSCKAGNGNAGALRYVPACLIYLYLFKHVVWHNHDCMWWKDVIYGYDKKRDT